MPICDRLFHATQGALRKRAGHIGEEQEYKLVVNNSFARTLKQKYNARRVLGQPRCLLAQVTGQFPVAQVHAGPKGKK